jgi:chemotaxis family two-component system sensor kinase Cph1
MAQTQIVSQAADLSNCDREPIHIPGAIQPHGMLFALRDRDLHIAQVSQNTVKFFGFSPAQLLGRSIEDVVGTTNFRLIQSAAARASIEDVNPLPMAIEATGGMLRFEAILHRSSGEIVLEMEPADTALPASFHRFYQNLRNSIVRFDAAHTVQELCAATVDEVARLTGFDRVMAYWFDEDWHGEVVAEERVSALEPFLGLHYPASDIPRQARELFRRNWVRYIADVHYEPAAIVPGESSVTGEPLDLARSVLRSASPIHLEYLKNMAVGASMTVSVIKNGELWGLIACHHRTPKMVPYEIRVACEVIARTMSLHLSSKEENEDIEHRMRLKSIGVELLGALSKDADIAGTLAASQENLLALVGASGAAIRYGRECRLVGKTPELADVLALVDWLRAKESDDVFVSDSLPLVDSRFGGLAATACGIIALPLSLSKGNYILWFRPETIVTVNWGGDPAKPVQAEPDGGQLFPRKSFALWREIVHFHAASWMSYEIDAARELRGAISSIIVERAEEIERVNRELAQSNIQLESFAHVASHDLKEPLRGIHNYASYLLEDYGAVVDAQGREKLETLIRLSKRMDALVESHLQLSRVGKLYTAEAPVDLRAILDEVVELYAPRLQQRGGSVSFLSPLPVVVADPDGLREVFSNLLSNAIKYTDHAARIEIGVGSAPRLRDLGDASADSMSREFVTIYVRDYGIGIREKHLEAIFTMFKRLHAVDRYGGGIGTGLALARKIVERYGGRIWATSIYGSETTFSLTLPLSV